ncbi:MAG: DUF262 domain-containing protein [Muribaculum sp.]|nr:DUF262 domain-containing protein [Muribaculum sp.]
MADNDKDFGKKLSLYEMLEKNSEDNIHKILIPKIQRDYAQGRESASAIRERFLKSLFDAIDKESGKELLLDFVFGQKEEKTRNIFYPVDGQQRLTTLFLLHLYVGKRCGAETEFLRKFSYETRTSSKQFCERLHEITPDNFVGIKNHIENQWWYTGLWRSDPTIMAMITMLDDIDNHYCQINYDSQQLMMVWNNLKTHVKFWRLYLSDLDTTDELYIKMNSRGKLLTDFEHFKAMLDEYAQTEGRLSAKIDTGWTNLLWRYRNVEMDFDIKKYANNGLDECFTNLLIFFLNTEGCKRGLIDYQYPEKDILKLADIVLGFHPDLQKEYSEEELKSEQQKKSEEVQKIMTRFEDILDFFSQKNENKEYIHDPNSFFCQYIKTNYNQWDVNVESSCVPDDVKVFIGNRIGTDLLREVCLNGLLKNEPTLYVEAFFEYAVSHDCLKSEDFKTRLRVLRNLIENTEMHARDFQNTLQLVDYIISTGQTSKPGISDEFNNKQKEQEAFKLNWIETNSQYANLLKTVENHWLVMGNLNIFIQEEENKKSLHIVSLERFGHLFHSNANYYSIEKALLTAGDYSPTPATKRVKGYGGSNWGLWRDLTQSFNSITPLVIQRFLNDNVDYSEEKLLQINSDFVNDELRKEFTWNFYMAKYDVINNAPRAKYRYMGGLYSYFKLNANGGGGPEYFWNPFNLAVESLIKNEIACETDSYGGPLRLNNKRLQINIREHYIEIVYPNGSTYHQPIPYNNETGIDTVDRVVYSAGVCRRVFNSYVPPVENRGLDCHDE